MTPWFLVEKLNFVEWNILEVIHLESERPQNLEHLTQEDGPSEEHLRFYLPGRYVRLGGRTSDKILHTVLSPTYE